MTTFLLAFGALVSIVNPLSGTFIFFGATRELEPRVRAQVSRWVAIYSFSIMAASLYVGAYVLSFFGISLPVLKIAGGLIVAIGAPAWIGAPSLIGRSTIVPCARTCANAASSRPRSMTFVRSWLDFLEGTTVRPFLS